MQVADSNAAHKILVYDSKTTAAGANRSKPEWKSEELTFDSRFESGNLKAAYRTADSEYTLVLEADAGSQDFTQWYYFSVATKGPAEVTFRIVNFVKETSLYSDGMQPLVRSKRREMIVGERWMREGRDISYTRSGEMRRKASDTGEVQYFYVLSFTYAFEFWYDTVYFAYSYPYTYTDLGTYLASISDKSDILTISTLCETPANTPVPRLTITNNISTYLSSPHLHRHKKAVCFTARVHPGESISSIIAEGAISFLLGDSQTAKALRGTFVFEIIPMLNPDGVKCGNYRCSTEGVDLNRVWNKPNKGTAPAIWYMKELIGKIKQVREVVFFVDIHGHSRKKGAFLYGCDVFPVTHPSDKRRNLATKALPLFLQALEPCFSFGFCSFIITKDKETTARVVCHRELGIMLSYTLETSFYCSRKTPSEAILYEEYLRIGINLCQSLSSLRQEKSFLRLMLSASEALGRVRRGTEESWAHAVGTNFSKSFSSACIPFETVCDLNESGAEWSLEATVGLGKEAWEQMIRKYELVKEEGVTSIEGNAEKDGRRDQPARSVRRATKLLPTRLDHIIESTPKPQTPHFRLSARPQLPKTPKIPLRLTTIELTNQDPLHGRLITIPMRDLRRKQDAVSKSAVLKSSDNDQGSSPSLKKPNVPLPEIHGATVTKQATTQLLTLNDSRSKSTRPDVRNYWDLLLDRDRIDPLSYLSHNQEGLVSAPPIRDYSSMLPGITASRVTDRPIDLAKLMAETTRLRIRREIALRAKSHRDV